MYSFIRLLIGCIFLICSFVLIKRSKTVHKKALYIVFFMFVGNTADGVIVYTV